MAKLASRRTIVAALTLALIFGGTPQVLAQDTAVQAQQEQALEASEQQRLQQAADGYESTGAPPDDERFRAMDGPPASNANPLYPANHTLDGSGQTLGTPLTNHDFESASSAVGSPPSNHDFSGQSSDVGTPPTNYDFETGSFSGWTTSGSNATIQTDATHGKWAKLAATGTNIISSAFTVDSSAQALAFDVHYISASGLAGLEVYVLSGPTYGTSTRVTQVTCDGCGLWAGRFIDATAWRGQSIQLKFVRYLGDIGVDRVRMATVLPDYTLAGNAAGHVQTEAGGNAFVRLDAGSFTTAAFTVDPSAQTLSLRVKGLTNVLDQYFVYVMHGVDYASQTQALYDGNAPDSWTTRSFTVSAWAGQSIKLKIAHQYKVTAFDDLGLQAALVPGWASVSDIHTTTGGVTGNALSAGGTVTSNPFTLHADVQQLSIAYKAESSGVQFHVYLLRGAGYTEQLDLSGNVTDASTSAWKTLKLGVDAYGGESVKLKFEHALGLRALYDNAGVQEVPVPGWTLSGVHGIQYGSDANGTWVQAVETGQSAEAVLRSEVISSGIIDRAGKQDLRYFAISYEIGYTTGSALHVYWRPAGGGSWPILQDTANAPTGYRTRYVPIQDSWGTDGYFEVQVPESGKVYAIADNIARQALNERFSDKVGAGIDTSTGSFGYQQQDLATEGSMPLAFARYYAGHSDQYGAMGYRWTHSYDTRLAITGTGGCDASQSDVGVVFGSGREVFFDWICAADDLPNRFEPADARVHETLAKNGDGTYTFTTTTNLKYLFTASGRLTSITDLNGNAITLTYDGAGKLTTVTDPGNRSLTLAYNAQGRIATVTDPTSAVWTYGYDANGDLTTVTMPDTGVWTYTYDAHRLTSVKNPLNDTIVTNTLDSVHRVTSQTDAAGNPLTFAYSTPAKGVTSVTDREGQTATFYFDRYGRTTDKLDPLNRRVSNLYDAVGNLQKVIDPAFKEWQFGYNAAGDVTGLTDPLGNPTTIVYNPQHLPTTVTDGRGNTTTYTYNANGNVTSIKDALNQTTTYTYDADGNLLTATNPLNHTITYTYDAQGNRTTITDPRGNVWHATYDASGRILTLTDPRNFTTTYGYDPLGRRNMIRDPLGNETWGFFDVWGRLLFFDDPLDHRTTWTYDDRGLITAKTDPAGKTTTYTYDDNGQMTSVTDALGHVTTYAYDAAGRLISETDPSGGVTGYGYDAAGRLSTVTDPLNRTAQYAYNEAGRMTSQTLSNGGVLTYTYDANGNLLTETNPLNQTTTYAYDAVNRLTQVSDPLNRVTQYVYDAAGRQTQIIDALNQTTTYTYDAANWLTSVTDPLNRTTSYGYDAAVNQTSVTDPLGHTTTFAYDGDNRVTSTTDALGNTTSYGYDAASRRTTTTLPSGAVTTTAYDARDLVTSITDHLGNVTRFANDDIGRRISTTDPRNFMTTYAYNAAQRKTTVTDALNGTLVFQYDAAGQLTSFTNPRGKMTSYTYNTLGQVLTAVDPLNRTTTYSYDTLGRLSGYSDPRGISVGFQYDAAGQLTATTFPGGSIGYAYDLLGRRTSMTDPTGTTTWTYDAASRVTSVAAPGGTAGYGYDNAGRRTSMTYPGNRTVTYGYDNADRMTSLTDWQNRTTSFNYNVNGQRTGITRPNGVTSTYGYDLAGRLTGVVHGGGGLGSNTSFNYTLDAAGNRTAVTGSRGSENYTLDALNRLTNVTYPNGDTAAYTYDANGNRLTQAVNGATTNTYTYDDADQLTSDGVRSYTYDQAGNQLTAGADTFTWDWRNRLTGATVNGTSSTYAYDGDNVRASQTTGGSTTTYVWDRTAGLPKLIDDGSNAYLHAGGILGQVNGANAASYPLADALGSVRTMTDGAGAPTGTADYGVFGDVRNTTGATSVFGHTGEQRDTSTGLTYLRARYHSSSQGRFLSADTVQPNAPGTQGYNRYAYTANNPTTWTDPSGHSTLIEVPSHQKKNALAAYGLALLAFVIFALFQFVHDCLIKILMICLIPDISALTGLDRSPVEDPTAVGGRIFDESLSTLKRITPKPPQMPQLPPRGIPGPVDIPGLDLPLPGLDDLPWRPGGGTSPRPVQPTPEPSPPATPAPSPAPVPEPSPSPQPSPRPSPQPTPQPTPPPGGTPTPTPTPDPEEPNWVVRGGVATADRLQKATSEHPGVPGLGNISVQYSPGRTVDELAAAGRFPHKQISYARAEHLYAAAASLGYAFAIVQSPGPGYHHDLQVPYPLPDDLAAALSEKFIQDVNRFQVPSTP